MNPGTTTALTVVPGRPVVFVLAVAYAEPLIWIDPESAWDLVQADESRWRERASGISEDIPFREPVLRSLLTLKQLTYPPSGAPSRPRPRPCPRIRAETTPRPWPTPASSRQPWPSATPRWLSLPKPSCRTAPLVEPAESRPTKTPQTTSPPTFRMSIHRHVPGAPAPCAGGVTLPWADHEWG